MRVLQSYVSRFLGYWEPFRIDMLIASAIQWKSVFPGDYLVLNVSPDIESYIKSKVTDLPWDEIYFKYGFDNHESEFYYDSGRFKMSLDQTEPFVFLDSDVYVFPEFRNERNLRMLQDVKSGKPEFLVENLPWTIDPPFNRSEFSKQVLDILAVTEDRDFENKILNTGFFVTIPELAKKVSEKVLAVQKCFETDRGEANYNSRFHEFASSTVPIMVLNREGVKIKAFDSWGMIHTCGCLCVLPEQQLRDFYIKEEYSTSDLGFARRLSYWKSFCKQVIEQGSITRKEAVSLMYRVKDELERKEKQTKLSNII